MRLVLVDNQPMFRDALAAALEDRGHELVACADPVTAAELTAEEHPEGCVWGFRSSTELPSLVAFRKATPEAVLVLVVQGSSSAVWQLYENNTISALVSHACGMQALEGALQETARGRRPVAGVRRATRPRPTARPMLTDRELEVLHMLADGVSTAQMSLRLELSAHTVRTHVHNVLHKLGAPRRVMAVRRAEELGLIQPHAVPQAV